MTDTRDRTPGGSTSLADLDPLLESLLTAPRWYVGFSGGVDSTVLLQCLHQWRAAHPGAPPLAAIHVNHALQPAADDWQRHCEAFCNARGIPLITARVDVRASGSAEAAAREARYRVFEAQLSSGSVVFLGHHLDDQVETVFLRLVRGAGVEGLAGIPPQRRLGAGILVRPLLHVARSAIERYAQRHGLAYVNDPSNDNVAMDRNFLRVQVLPLLASRWPGYRQAVGRASRHMAGAAAVLADELGVPQTVYSTLGDAGLDLRHLLEGSGEVAAVRIRLWLRAAGHQAPDSARLVEFVRQLRAASVDAGPRLVCGGYSLQRYLGAIYLLPAWKAPPPTEPVALSPGAGIRVPGVGTVTLQPGGDRGLALRHDDALTLRWRRGGERCRLPGRSGNRRLKTLWQEWRIPPWWRHRVPLLCLDQDVLAVGDIACCDSSRWRPGRSAGEPLWNLHWERDAGGSCD